MAKPLKTVVEFIDRNENSDGTAVPKENANRTETYRAGAELIPYRYDQPKQVVKFYDKEDVKKACQAWEQPYSGPTVPLTNNYVVMQYGSNGWNQYNIGAPLMRLPWEDMGFYPIGKNYYCNSEGFFIMLDKRGPVQFTDFLMCVSSINEHYMFDDEETSKSFEVAVLDSLNYPFKLDVPASKWKNLLTMIEAQDPVCTIFMDEVSRAAYYFQQVAALLLHRRNIPHRTIVDRWGWGPVKPDGSREFYHGGRDDCTSEKKLLLDPTISLTAGWSIVDVGEHSATVPLLLYGAACYMDAIFTDAGYPLDFCLMLIGESGYMKTAFSKVLFNVFADHASQIHSVRGTEAAMHALTEEHWDDIAPIDDFNLEGGTAEVRQKMKNIQGLIRTYSDKSPKEKYSSAKKHTTGYKVRGGAVFTAETAMLGQIKSAELRYLKVVMQHPMTGERLSVFQQNPAIIQSFWSAWIRHLEGHYVQIFARIQQQFPSYRKMAPVAEPRLKDDFAHLLCVLDEMARFVENNCGCSVDRKEYGDIIARLVCKQAEEANQVEPYIRFLAEIFALLGTGQLKLAPNLEAYASDLLPFIGYRDGDLIMLKSDVLYTEVIEATRRRGDELLLTINDLKKKLKENGLIQCDKEGFLKKAPSKIPGRPRMLALRHQACLKKLEGVNI